MVYFLIPPSVRVVHLVTKVQKWALTELGWPRGLKLGCTHIFFQFWKNGSLFFGSPIFAIYQSISKRNRTKAQKWVLTELGFT